MQELINNDELEEIYEELLNAIGFYALGKTLQSTKKILYNNKVFTLDGGTKVGENKTDG